MQELWFLCSVCHLMLIDVYMKFREEQFSSYRADTILWQSQREIIQKV